MATLETTVSIFSRIKRRTVAIISTSGPRNRSSIISKMPTAISMPVGPGAIPSLGIMSSTFSKAGKPSTQFEDANQVKTVIKDYLKNVKYDRNAPYTSDTVLENAVRNYFNSLDLGQRPRKAIQKVFQISVTFAHQAYAKLPLEIKIDCAIQFVLMFLVDDIADEFMDGLESFNQKFVLNQKHGHVILDAYDQHIRSLSKYYGPYGHSCIIKSSIDYVNGRVIEYRMEQADFKFPSGSTLMPIFLRHKVGAAEILIQLLWPQAIFPEREFVMLYFPAIPAIVQFVDFTNDIMSYYKEIVLNDEKGNLVSNLADVHEVTPVDVLPYLANNGSKALSSARQLFEPYAKLRESLQAFTDGWLMFHTAHRRYHLEDLFGGEGFLSH